MFQDGIVFRNTRRFNHSDVVTIVLLLLWIIVVQQIGLEREVDTEICVSTLNVASWGIQRYLDAERKRVVSEIQSLRKLSQYKLVLIGCSVSSEPDISLTVFLVPMAILLALQPHVEHSVRSVLPDRKVDGPLDPISSVVVWLVKLEVDINVLVLILCVTHLIYFKLAQTIQLLSEK